MNEHSASAPPPTPGPLCAAYSPMLPLLDTRALTREEEDSLREHLAGCAWCQNQLAAYAVAEAALRQHYSSIPSAQTLTMEDIMRANDYDTQPTSPGRRSNRDDLPSSYRPDQQDPYATRRGGWSGGREPRRRTPWGTIGAVAAAVLVVVLAGALFASMRLQPQGPGSPPAASATATSTSTASAPPNCNSNFANSPIKGVQSSVEGVPLPPTTYVVPDDAANLHGYDLCSAGTTASVTAYLTSSMPAAGWTKVASDPRCFYADECWTKGGAAISWHVDDPTDWHIAYHPNTP